MKRPFVVGDRVRVYGYSHGDSTRYDEEGIDGWIVGFQPETKSIFYLSTISPISQGTYTAHLKQCRRLRDATGSLVRANARIAQLEEALQFYADPTTYLLVETPNTRTVGILEKNPGYYARKALDNK
jgi:hypothetical protein